MTLLPLVLSAVLAQAAVISSPARKATDVIGTPLPGDSLQATVHKLSNGMTVYLSPNKETPRVAAWIAVRTGSKNDPQDSTGLAHYLEHMLFKGTRSLGTLDHAKEKPRLDRIRALYEEHFKTTDAAQRAKIYKQIDAENIEAAKQAVPNELAKIYRQLGFRDLNAFTSNEETVYVVDMPSNRMEAWATLEKERFSSPVFRLFQSELEAVYEEKNRSLDNAHRIIGEALNRALYKVHPYGQQTTIGEVEHLKNPSLEQMYAYYARWYQPSNMAVALSGDFERKAVLELLERTLGTLPAKAVPAEKTWALPAPKGTERVEVFYEAEERVSIAWLTVPHRHADASALNVLDMLMDNAAAGLINLELVQAQKVKLAGSSPSFYNDAGDWEMYAIPRKGQTLEQAEALLLETLEHLKQGKFTDEDIKAVITAFEVNEKSRLESNEARVGVMAESFIHREPWPEAAARLEKLRRVTKADVLRVAGKYLGADKVVAFRRNGKPKLPNIPKPSFTKVDLDESRQSAFAKKLLAMPAAPIEPRWLVEGRDYRLAQLPSGKAYAARNPFNDLFTLTFSVKRGSRQERKLCAAMSLWALAGGGDLSAEDFKKKLFALGTTLSHSCSEQDSSVTLSGLDENLWESLELMRARFEKPHVAPGTLENMVEVAIGAHQDTKKEPGAIYRALGQYARRGKESSVLDELSDDELRKLAEPELKELIRSWPTFARRTAYVGNRPLGELGKLLEESREWRQPPARRAVRLLRSDTPRMLFAHREMVQAQVGLSVPDDEFRPERAVDYLFYGSYLGGGMSSVIFQEIREARSLAYSAWGGYSPAVHKGDDNELYAGLGCQADKAVEAASLLRDLSLGPPWSDARFVETHRSIEENYRTNPISFRSIPGVLMGWEDQGLPPGDPRPERFEKTLRYTLKDLESFGARFKGRPVALWVLGDRARLPLEGLKKLGAYEERALGEIFPY
jgi:predicted Zn-dependent peptidase